MELKLLKDLIYKLYDDNTKYSLIEFNNLIKNCVDYFEMNAVVFLYDSMKRLGINPNKETYNLINKLHSKTIIEKNNIYIKNQNVGKLKARRRIHKIMKGYNYSANYNNALKHLEKVKCYIKKNKEIVNYGRIKLAKNISKNCKITFNESRYIITNLKRTKFLNSLKKNNFLAPYKDIPINKYSSNLKLKKQKKITDFFK